MVLPEGGDEVPQIWNAGKDIIDAYLKGVAVRQEKEHNQQQYQIALEKAKLEEQQLKQTLAIANQTEKGRNERAKLTNDIQIHGNKIRELQAKVDVAKWVQ